MASLVETWGTSCVLFLHISPALAVRLKAPSAELRLFD